MSLERIDSRVNFPVSSDGVRKPSSENARSEEAPAQSGEDSVELSSSQGAVDAKEGKAPKKKNWTVLAYLAGKDGTMQRLAPGKMQQLEGCGSDEDIDIVAQLSRQKWVADKYTHDWSGTRRYHVEKNPQPGASLGFIPPYTQNIASPVKEDLGEMVDAADPGTIKDFVKWGIKNYPAEHYAILFYGQGGGFTGSIYDADTGSVLSSTELGDVVKEAAKEAGRKIDLVAFDGSLMASTEVVDALKEGAGIFVASQGVTNQSTIPVTQVMKDLKGTLKEKDDVTAEELAKFFIYETKYTSERAPTGMTTLSALNLEKFDTVKDAYKALSGELLKSVKTSPELGEALRENIKKTQNFFPGKSEPYEDYRDVAHFARNLLEDARFNNSSFPGIEKASKDLLTACGEAVIDNVHTGAGVKDAAGISAYMPTDYGFDMAPTFTTPPGFDPKHGYDKDIFALETQWNDVLATIAKDTKMHERMRKLGLPDGAINKLDIIGSKALSMAKFALGIATNAGHYEAYQAMKNKPAAKFMLMPAGIASKVGIAGGGKQAFNGACQVFQGIADDTIKNRQMMIVDGGFDAATGAAVMATCVGLSFAQYAGIARPAGISAFAIPFAKMAYDVYQQVKAKNATKREADELTPMQKLEKLEIDKQEALRGEADGGVYVSPIVEAIAKMGSSGPVKPRNLTGKED
jgi:hypothetical protein